MGRKLVTVVGSEDGNVKSQLARSLIDPLGVYIALLCVQLPPWCVGRASTLVGAAGVDAVARP